MDANLHLSNKKALFYNMKVYYEATGQYPFDFLPLTFHITDGVNSTNFDKFTNCFNDPEQNADLIRNPQLGTALWIVKPGENTNRGCGINVCKDLSHIKGIISNN
jgi:tubulin--tyrosine ligase